MIRWRENASLVENWLERHERAVLLGLLAMAFFLRLLAVWLLPLDYRFEDDAVRHVDIARNLLASGVFGVEPGVPYALIPPGYPVLVAAVLAVTNQSLVAVRLVQVALGTLMVWLTYRLGMDAATRWIGLLAAFLCAVYPVWIVWPALFLTETLYTVLLLGFVWCLIRSLRSYTIRYTVLTGVLFGLALLTREVLLMFPPLLLVALWWARTPWRNAWRYVLLFAVAVLVPLSPWLARNTVTFGEVFYTDRTEALRYQFTGSGYLSPRYQYLVDKSIPPPISSKPPEFYERFGYPGERISVKHLLADPWTYVQHLFNRLMEVWLHPNGLESLPDHAIVRGVYIALHAGLLCLAGVGAAIGLKRRDLSVGILVLLLVYTTGTSLFFTSPNPRYILPFLPLIFILAGLGLQWAWQFARRDRPSPVPTAHET